jgi:hypothetical protein
MSDDEQTEFERPRATLPAEIQEALIAARVKPEKNQCYMNAAFLVMFQEQVPLLYVEGVVRFGADLFGHAWVRTQSGEDVDITLSGATSHHAKLILDRPELIHRLRLNNNSLPLHAQLQKEADCVRGLLALARPFFDLADYDE